MKVLSSKDITRFVNNLYRRNENIDVFAGDKDEKRVILVKKGLKIRHTPSGLVYTVLKVILPDDENDLKILCHRPGKKLLIARKEFKSYERH